MKNILFILLFTAYANYAQTTIIPVEQMADYLPLAVEPDQYFKDINHELDKFVGTWKYQDNAFNPSKVLYVTFVKTTSTNTSMHRNDYLYGTYRYYENGVEIFNTEQEPSPYIYGGMFRNPEDTSKYGLIEYDEPIPGSKGFKKFLEIQRLSTDPPQLKWDLEIVFEVAEGATLPRIPQHIVLTKQP